PRPRHAGTGSCAVPSATRCGSLPSPSPAADLCPSGSRRSCGCSMAGAKVQKPVGGRVGAAYPRNAPFRIGSRPMTLIARDLTVEIGSKTIVRGVSFDVRPGDKVGLVGRNGAGKTTLFKVLGGE